MVASAQSRLPMVTLPLGQLFERIEDLHARAAKVPIVPGDDSQAVATGRGGDVTVGQRHSQPGFVEGQLLLRPDVCDGYAEAQYAPLPCIE